MARFIFECISDIDSNFLQEVEDVDIVLAKAQKRVRNIKYGVAGVAGIAVSVGLAMMYKGKKRSAA